MRLSLSLGSDYVSRRFTEVAIANLRYQRKDSTGNVLRLIRHW
jgi:hypothetical protein